MGEILPLAAGVLVGLIAMHLSVANRTRIVLLASISAASGVAATLINGEELFFIPIDMAIVGLCAGVVAAATRLGSRLILMRTNRP
ncbi:MAG: hypothetical protein ABR615_00945 [Pseudonocardiaceae bacterium]